MIRLSGEAVCTAEGLLWELLALLLTSFSGIFMYSCPQDSVRYIVFGTYPFVLCIEFFEVRFFFKKSSSIFILRELYCLMFNVWFRLRLHFIFVKLCKDSHIKKKFSQGTTTWLLFSFYLFSFSFISCLFVLFMVVSLDLAIVIFVVPNV